MIDNGVQVSGKKDAGICSAEAAQLVTDNIQLSDKTGTSNRTGFYGQMLQKNSFLAANTQDGFGEHRDKKYPMCTMKYTAVFLMLGAYISAGGPGHGI